MCCIAVDWSCPIQSIAVLAWLFRIESFQVLRQKVRIWAGFDKIKSVSLLPHILIWFFNYSIDVLLVTQHLIRTERKSIFSSSISFQDCLSGFHFSLIEKHSIHNIHWTFITSTLKKMNLQPPKNGLNFGKLNQRLSWILSASFISLFIRSNKFPLYFQSGMEANSIKLNGAVGCAQLFLNSPYICYSNLIPSLSVNFSNEIKLTYVWYVRGACVFGSC